jgi:hypothetical protein
MLGPSPPSHGTLRRPSCFLPHTCLSLPATAATHHSHGWATSCKRRVTFQRYGAGPRGAQGEAVGSRLRRDSNIGAARPPTRGTESPPVHTNAGAADTPLPRCRVDSSRLIGRRGAGHGEAKRAAVWVPKGGTPMRHTLRGAMLIGAGAGTAVVLTFAPAGAAPPTNWPQWAQNPQHQGFSTWSARA